MKKLYYLFALFSFYSLFAQELVPGGTPVEGVIPIVRENYQPRNSVGKLSGLEAQSLTPGVPTGSSTETGHTEGTLSVSASGGATYTVPISVLPGIKGIAPKISLTYDSQSGNDIAGYGWSIAGISAITRVAATKYHDGVADPVDFNNLDRFALDGQRLQIKSGTLTPYGADGAIYETENFSNLKITSYGVSPYGASYGPQYFVVEYPDGSKARYGNTPESRTPDKWSIDYWENPQGIRISYAYDSYLNTSRLLRITYGTSGTTPGINTIIFGYKNRNRTENAYIAGTPFTQFYTLSYIQVSSGDNSIHRKYALNHDITSLGYERLTSITESAGSGSTLKTLNPTVFTYNHTTDAIVYSPIATNLSVNDISYRNAATVTGDFNGDGKMDIIAYPTYGPDARKKYWFFTNFQEGSNNIGTEVPVPLSFDEIFPVSWLGGDQSFGYKLMQTQGWTLVKTNTSNNTTTFSTYSAGTAAPVYFQYSKSYQFPKFIYGYFKEPCNPGNPGMLGTTQTGPANPNEPVYVEIVKDIPRVFLSGDFNGDGLTDVMVVNKSVSYSYTQGCSTYNQTRLGGASYFVNLDKRLTSNFVNIAGQMTTTDNSDFRIVDYNGDGKADILVFDTGKVTVYTLNNNNQLVQLLSYSDAHISLDYPILIGDYNGDGKADFITPTGNGNNSFVKFTSTGISFTKTSHAYDIPYIPSKMIDDCSLISYIIPSDFNADGKTDLIYVENIGCIGTGAAYIAVRYFKNTSTNFTSSMSATTTASETVDRYSLPAFIGFDKINSSQDISFISKNNIFNFTSSKSNDEDTKLQTITLGNGVKEAITYSPLSAPDTDTIDFVYDDSPYVENYPYADIIKAPSITVVSRLERQSKNEYKKQDYRYFGAVYNIEGLGFLGFRATMSTNWYNDSYDIISNVSKFDISKRGALSESYTVTALALPSSNFAPTSFITKSTNTYTSTLLPNKVFKIKTDASILYNGLEGITTETATTYDDYNNPLTRTTLAKQGNTVDKKDVVTLVYFNQPQGTPYIIGRPDKKNTETYGTDQMNTEELYTYNANNLLSEVKTKGHNTEYLTTAYEYDTFGNIRKTTLSATGITPRINSFEYDASGRFITKSTSVEGLITTYTYNNNNGLPLTITTPDNRTLTHEYDIWGKKTKATNYFSTTFTYSNVNEKTLIKVSGDDGSYSESLSDDLGRVIKSGVKNIDGSVSYTDYLYDIYDRKIKVSEPYTGSSPSQWNEVKFDKFDRLIKSIAATGKTETISYSGLTTSVFDGLKTESIIKNAANNVVSKTDDISTNNTISNQYFANGGLKQVNYGNSNISVEQDGWGRRTQLKDPSAGTCKYKYNALGEITEETTPQGYITYLWDDFGRLIFKRVESINDYPFFYYEYNPDGTLANINTDNSTIDGDQVYEAYEYDNFKRPKKIVYITITAAFTKELTYDSFGRIEKEKVTAKSLTNNKTSTQTFKYTYKNGYIHQILNEATNQVLWATNSVNQRGQLTNGSFGNGLTQVNTYDAYGFPSVFETKTATGSLFNFTTYFDPIRGNLGNRSNSLFTTYEPFEYDNQDRLIKWNKEIVSIINTNFNAGTEQFVTHNNATLVNSNAQLKVTATTANAGISKTLLTQARIGDKVLVSFNVYKGTTDKVRVVITEKNPLNGQERVTFKAFGQNGVINFEHIVSLYPQIDIRIDKDAASTDVGTATIFYVDDLWAGKMIIETQQYDDRGRITENSLGQYVYPDSGKIYQNTAIDLNPETASYYKNREGIFNDGMEEQKGWSDLGIGWEIFTKPVYDDSRSKTGKYALKLYNPTTSLKSVHTDRWIPISNTTSTQYTYSGWVYSDGPDAQLQFFMKKEGETDYFTYVDNYFVGTKNQWVYVEKTFTVPADVTRLNIRLDNNGGGNVWFDDIRITKTANPATTLRELNISYNLFRKPKFIEETGIEKISFKYNDSQYRTSMFYGGFQTDETQRQFRKDYSGDGSMEITTNKATGESSFVFFVGGAAYTAPLIVKDNGTAKEYFYLHRDYQGSIMAISNQAGAIVEKRLFDPWGNIVKVQDGQGNELAGLTVLDRGYTGHEHIQSVGLINMNGRLYDPKLHRFLSPDNYIQDPYNTQNYNRYAYVLNNPLKYVDYNGENYGNEYNSGGPGTGGQIAMGNSLLAIRDNWDQWGIKEWAARNFSARNFDNAYQNFTNFFDRNYYSITNWFDRNFNFLNHLFGSNKTQIQPIAPPQFSNFKNTQSWQNTGFMDGVKYGGDGGGGFMDYLHKFIYLTDQVNPIALAWDGISGFLTGEDRYGNALNGTESGIKLVTAIPIAEAEMLASNALSKVTAKISSGFASKSISRTGSNLAAKGVGNLTKSQLKSISSLESQIATHQTKLAEYIKNPMKFDNKGFLKNAPNDAVRQKIIQSRINHLNQEIKTFQNNIQKILNGQ